MAIIEKKKKRSLNICQLAKFMQNHWINKASVVPGLRMAINHSTTTKQSSVSSLLILFLSENHFYELVF